VWLFFDRSGTVAPAPLTSLAPETARQAACWSLSVAGLILRVMRRPVRKTRFDGAVLADSLFLIGQAWVKSDRGDHVGAAGDLAAARKLIPADSVEAIQDLIAGGFLPEPGPGPEAMDAWPEACRQAGAGEWTLTRLVFPSAGELEREERDAFMARLDQIVAESEARRAAGEMPPPGPPAPKRPVRHKKHELDEPGAVSESLRRMGLM